MNLPATTLAESFELPGWVDYFRLVKMEATTDAPVANPPPFERYDDGEGHAGVSLVLFSHSFTGVKEQNSALLQSPPAGATWWSPSITRTTPRWCSTRTDRPPIFEGTTCPANSRGTGGDFDTNTRVGALTRARAERMVDANWFRPLLFRKIDLSRCPSSDTLAARR